MDHSNKIEFKIRDLGTRAVTLFPTQAQVTREIKDVRLKVSPRSFYDSSNDNLTSH